MQKNRCWFILILVLIVMNSCDDHQVFDEYKTIPNEWDKNNPVAFKVTPPDSINPYNLYINLRNNNDYQYSNLFLIVELNYPNGKTLKDTLEYKMANPDGSFLGTGFTDIKENKLWYKGFDEPFIFEETGEYTINIQHAMRQNGVVEGIQKLNGVTEVGFRIEKKMN